MRLFEAVECGKDGYPQEWHATIKHAVRAEAGNRCVRCLHPYTKGAGEWSPCVPECHHGGPVRFRLRGTEEWGILGKEDVTTWAWNLGMSPRDYEMEAAWRILTVHHLDGDKANCRWWNLAALCQRCHLQIQGKVQMARVWPWEHSEWFEPYVAGYYAWTYLGEDLSREEVMARLDDLLALERAA